MDRNSPRWHSFLTALGWMGVVGRGGVLSRVIPPVERRSEVERLVRDFFPGARRAREDGLLAAADQLADYAAGGRRGFHLPLDLPPETTFRGRVLRACRGIPFGEWVTYGELAAAVGRPGAARAVGRVMRANPFPIIVPCHRVLGKGGRLAGYSAPGGLVLKARLLAHEGVTVQADQALPAGPAR